MQNEDGKSITRRNFLKGASVIGGALVLGPTISYGSNKNIKIGLQADLSGFLSLYGRAFDLGARGAVEYINNNGGIAGRKLEYIYQNTQTKVPTGVRAFRGLVHEGADFVLGSTSSSINLATNRLAEQLNTIVFPQGEATSVTETKGNPHVFRIRQPSKIQARAVVDFAGDKFGKRWTIMISDYEYGHSFYSDLVPLLKQSGNEILDLIAVPVQAQDMAPYISKISGKTDVIFSTFPVSSSERFLRQTAGLAKKMVRIGSWGMVDGINLSSLQDTLENAYFLTVSPRWLDQVPSNLRPYVAQARRLMGIDDNGRLKESDNIVPTSYYLAPWQTLSLIKKSVESSGWESKKDNQKIIAAMKGFEGEASQAFPMGDFVMAGAAGHQAVQNIWVTKMKDGELTLVTKAPYKRLLSNSQ